MSNRARSITGSLPAGSARTGLRRFPLAVIALSMVGATIPASGQAQTSRLDRSVQQPVSDATGTAGVPELESPSASTRTSLLATIVPTAAGIGLFAGGVENPLLALGLYLGPAAGYWTGGVGDRGWSGVGLRSGIAVGGGLLAMALCGDGWGCENEGAVTAVLLATGAGLVASAVHDIVSVDDHVEARNEELRQEGSTSVSVVPTLSPADGGTFGFSARVTM